LALLVWKCYVGVLQREEKEEEMLHMLTHGNREGEQSTKRGRRKKEKQHCSDTRQVWRSSSTVKDQRER